MIANVTLTFKIIGGMGLKEPVEQLQNALSFNYYANTEIYDERSNFTDTSFEKFDTEIVDSIKQKQQNEKTTVPEQPRTNGGGTTIGKIDTTVVTSGGTTGTLDYTDIMNNLEKETKNYLKNIINQSETIVKNYNFGVLSLTNYKRNYTSGTFIVRDSTGNIEEGTNLYGKSDSYEERLNSLFDQVISDIDDGQNPIVLDMVTTGKYKDATIRDMKNNMINFIKNLKNDFTLKLTTTIQDISTQEQNLTNLISKINLVQQGYDGIIDKQGTPTMYQLTFLDGSDVKLGENYAKVSDILNSFYDSLDTEWGLTSESNWDDVNKTFAQKNNIISEQQVNRFYTIIYQTFKNKNDKDNFINTIINENLIISSEKQQEKGLKSKFTEIVNGYVVDFDIEYKEELNIFNTINNNSSFVRWTKDPYYKDVTVRKTSFVTNNSAEETYKSQLTSIYSTVNTNTDKSTYNGKIKFN
jgi:hypothetical protein